MLKYAHAQIMTSALAPQDASARDLRRFAHRHHFDYEVRPGYLYVRSRAISSRCNDNFDEFPAEELEKSYRTFIGKPVFVNHHNDDHKRARGVIIDAALHKDSNRDGSKDYWVEVLMEVDALRFPKLAAEIMNGNIARTSMGCDVAFSVCSACGNKATTPAEYCQHIPASKGMTLYRTTASGHKVGEIIRETCYGLKFFENSLLVEPPADPTALVLGVESGDMSPRRASANGPDRRGGYAVPNGYVLQSELTAPGAPLAGRHLGQQLPLDDPDVGLGQSALGVGGPRHAAASFDHVPGVLPVGPQDPMTGVVAEGDVTGVSNHVAGRYRADQGRVAPSVGPDGTAPGVVQGQASVSVFEGASGPQVAGIRSTAGVDLGQVSRKNTHGGQRTVAASAPGLSWDEIGERHPHVYGDPEIHGEAADGADGEGIGWAAQHLAFDRPGNEDGENDGSSVHDLTFHHVHVPVDSIDFQHHSGNDGRVEQARRGYESSNPERVPPLVLIHRHGVFQVADGHHRAQGARDAGLDTVPAYVAKSPHPRSPFSDGERAPYHGAEPMKWSPPRARKAPAAEAPSQTPSWTQDRLFEAKRVTLAELMAEGINQEGGELPAFPWDKAPKINLPMTQKGWDEPRRQEIYDAKGEHDLQGPPPPTHTRLDELVDRLGDYAAGELTNPYGVGQVRPGEGYHIRQYPGDKKEQWARQRWEQAHWPRTDAPEGQARSSEGLMRSKKNIRDRWSKVWKRPLACDHNSCPPWAHGGDAMTPSSEVQPQADNPFSVSREFMEKHKSRIHEIMEERRKGKNADGGDGTTKEGAQQYPNPADHPWFKETGLSHENVIHHWDLATSEEKKQGARWYPDAHLVAKSIAKLDTRIKTDAEAAHKGAGVLSAYSPQQGWWANQHNAARSFQEQRALGKGEGIMIMASHANAAQKIMDGMPHHEALKGPKTQDFAHLIEHGGYKPQSEEDEAAGKEKEPSDKVVIDRHALSVAAGRRLNADDVKGFPSQSRHYYEHAAEQYRRAAAVISDRQGRRVAPHEVQAVTWLVRQRLNSQEDNSPGQKGRDTVQRNQRTKWQDLTKEHTPELHEPPANSHVSGLNGDLPEGISFAFHRNYKGGGNHAIEAMVPHPQTGEPQRAGYLEWFPNHGMIDMIETHRDYRRRGIGDAMLGRAHEMAQVHGLTPPRKSDVVFPDGEAWNGHSRMTSGQDFSANPTRVAEPPQPKHQDIRQHLEHEHQMNTKGLDWPDEVFHQTHDTWHQHGIGNGGDTFHVHGSRKLAYGEQKAPADVDTLREDACPVCGDRDTYDGATCQVCGYVAPPKIFQDPDLEMARQMDLRKDIGEFQDPANPMAPAQLGPDGQPLDPQAGPMDPTALDENGRPVNPDAADPTAQPGSLPGEIQAEVQPGDQPVDPSMLGPDGQPLNPQGIPNELGAPVDPAMLGPDGQPLQQPGQQMMVGPDGQPIGPQQLPPDAVSDDGKPFTPGPNMPQGPGEPELPEGPEGPVDQNELGPDGQVPNPGAGQGVPGTPGDGVPDLQCPACGFQADATNPVSVDMDTSLMPPSGQATPDGVQAGDVCPNCGSAQLISPAEAQGQVPMPMPV